MKTFIFQLMRTFRWLIVPLLKILSGLFCIIMLVAIFSNDPKVAGFDKVLLSFVFAIGFGSLSWYYDVVMKKFSPVNQNNQEWS